MDNRSVVVSPEDLIIPDNITQNGRRLYSAVWNQMYGAGTTSICIQDSEAASQACIALGELASAQNDLVGARLLSIEREQTTAMQDGNSLYVYIAPISNSGASKGT